MMKVSVRGIGLAVALLIAPLLSGCDEAPQQPAATQAPPVAVTVVKAETRDLRPSVNFSGRVTALQKVDLRARIEGFLDKQNFAEGANVKTGDLLFVIEKAPYEAKVASAEGAVSTAKARLDRTEIELKRQTTLVSKDAAAQTKLDDARAARDEARGSLDKLTGRTGSRPSCNSPTPRSARPSTGGSGARCSRSEVSSARRAARWPPSWPRTRSA